VHKYEYCAVTKESSPKEEADMDGDAKTYPGSGKVGVNGPGPSEGSTTIIPSGTTSQTLSFNYNSCAEALHAWICAYSVRQSR
jgi:hypothetical protein